MSAFNPGVMTTQAKTIQSARALLDASQYDTAIPLLREAVEREPRNALLLRMLGYALVLVDKTPEGLRHLELSSKLNPSDPDVWCDMSMGLRRMDRLGEAHQALDKVLKDHPGYPRAVALKGRLLQSRGQSDKAMAFVEEMLEHNQDPTIQIIYGNLARELKRQGPAIDMIRATLDDPKLVRPMRTELYFALGHLLDSVGEYDDAFRAFDAGNKMTAAGEPADFDGFLSMWTKEDIAKAPRAEQDASRVVLVVGMPRSGTTLTEQILGAHPKAEGIGERGELGDLCTHKRATDFDAALVAQCAGAYHAMIRETVRDPRSARVVDKMPENYFFLGGASFLLPGAHVINCTRDPRDTCLSIYFQRFGPAMRYANDLKAVAQQYLGYLRVMDHWREALDLTIHDSSYEALTADPEPNVRALLDHIGLGFDKACLEHHKSKSSVHTASAGQVRQPVYTSSQQRWKRYEKHLGPMLEVFGDRFD
jgi:tetratricopeptide (TPR) repeat protein